MFSLFFAFLLVSGISYLVSVNAFGRSVSMPDFFLMALAVWRLTRLVTYDAIMKFFREMFEGAQPGSFRGTLHALINCPWCTGLWFGFFVVFFYFATPYAWPVLLILAVSAVGSFFQVLSNLVGWSAEAKKREVLGHDNSASTCG